MYIEAEVVVAFFLSNPSGDLERNRHKKWYLPLHHYFHINIVAYLLPYLSYINWFGNFGCKVALLFTLSVRSSVCQSVRNAMKMTFPQLLLIYNLYIIDLPFNNALSPSLSLSPPKICSINNIRFSIHFFVFWDLLSFL